MITVQLQKQYNMQYDDVQRTMKKFLSIITDIVATGGFYNLSKLSNDIKRVYKKKILLQ